VAKSAMEGKLESLPNWAQRKIAHQELAIENLRKYYGDKFREVCGNTETPVKLDMAYAVEGFVPCDTRVIFTTVDQSELTVHFNKERTGITVYKMGRIVGQISVRPETTNVVEVT
jgi:hypothetical protein